MDIVHRQHIETIIESIRRTTKYSSVSLDLIRAIAEQEVMKRRNLKEAIKSTKNKLHQVGAAYITQKPNYSLILEQLQTIIQSEKQDDLLRFSSEIISCHASTKERLPILEQFYQEIFAQIPPITSILDIACGLNPLTIPWMKLNDNVTYYAYDIYEDMIQFVNSYLKIINIQGYAKICNVIQKCPDEKVDVAFIFNFTPSNAGSLPHAPTNKVNTIRNN